MIYAYFDERGTLKELINTKNFNSGDSNVDKIAVYWESDNADYSVGIRYQLADKSFFPLANMDNTGIKQTLKIPYNQKQDLIFFKYETNYPFRVFTIPDEVLDNETNGALPVLVSVFFIYGDNINTLDRFAFNVGPSTSGVYMDEHIDLAEWNTLMKIVFNKQLYIMSDINYVTENLDQYNDYDMFFTTDDNLFRYKLNGQLNTWNNLNVEFDEVPTEDSDNLVTSGGVYSWVLNQLADLQTFNVHICTSADDTPYGVTWDDVTGTLQPEDALSATFYLVPDGENAYVEYYPVLVSENTYSWEIIGDTRMNLPDVPSSNGKYSLMVSIASGSTTYSWVDETEFIITSSGTTFDRTDPRYKLKYSDELYYYVSDGVYVCVSNGSTIKKITVDSSTYAWTVASTNIDIATAVDSDTFTIGNITYTITNMVTQVITVTDGSTTPYVGDLSDHPDWLIKLSGSDNVYHYIGTGTHDKLYYASLPMNSFGAVSSLSLSLVTISDDGTVNFVGVTTVNKVLGNPAGGATSQLHTISIGGVIYSIVESVDIDTSEYDTGTLTTDEYNLLFNSALNVIIDDDRTYHIQDFNSGNMIYVSVKDNDIAYININGTTKVWTKTVKKLRKYLISVVVTTLVGNPQQTITFDVYTYDKISNNQTSILTALQNIKYSCDSVLYFSTAQVNLVKTVELSAPATGTITCEYHYLRLSSGDFSFAGGTLSSSTYTIDDISCNEEVL